MKFVIGGLWIILCSGLLLAMLSGRVKLRGCCGATDAECDLRLRDQARTDAARGSAVMDGSSLSAAEAGQQRW